MEKFNKIIGNASVYYNYGLTKQRKGNSAFKTGARWMLNYIIEHPKILEYNTSKSALHPSNSVEDENVR